MITPQYQEDFINSIPQFKDVISHFYQSNELLNTIFSNLLSDNLMQANMSQSLQKMQFIANQSLSNAIAEFIKQAPDFNPAIKDPEQIYAFQTVLWQILEKHYLQMLANNDFQQAFADLINNAAKDYSPHHFKMSDKITLPTAITFDECAKTIIYQKDRVTLYHYESLAPQRIRTPLLIVYALVNRPTILDLQADRSLIRQLLLAGLDIYLIDWGNPTEEDSNLSLKDYLADYIKHSVNQICQTHQVKAINMLGVCQGGIMSVCYAALNPKQIKNLITIVTPVEYHSPENILGKLLQYLDIDLIVEKWGNISGICIAQSLLNLRPFRLLQEKYRPIIRGTATSDQVTFFSRMESWLHDCPDHPRELFREFIKYFYQQNNLMNNKIVIGKKTVKLKNITMPVLNIYAHDDHLVPPSAAKPLANAISTLDYTELEYKSGHIGVFVSNKALTEIPKLLTEWLEQRDVQKK